MPRDRGVRRPPTRWLPASDIGTTPGCRHDRLLRRDHHRKRCGWGNPGPPPGAVGKAGPAAGAWRVAAAGAAELAGQERVRGEPLRLARHVVLPRRLAAPSGGAL